VVSHGNRLIDDKVKITTRTFLMNMPGDNAHNVTGFALLLGGVYYLFDMGVNSNMVMVFAASYVFSLLMLSPDLDVNRGSASLRRWGPFGFLWYPYKELFRHRGMSHNLLLGPLTRLLYFGLLVWVIFSAVNVGIKLPALQKEVVLAFVAGIWLPDVLHCLLDRTVTWMKSD